MQALESTSPLIIYIDIKSPYAFVAIQADIGTGSAPENPI